MIRRLLATACLTLSALAGTAVAAEPGDAIRAAFAARFPNAQIDHLTETPVSGVFEVGVGSQVFYVSADGRYVFNGKLIDLQTREDLSETYLSRVRLSKLDAVDEESMIVFEPDTKAKHTITVFTDIDCPYCRKLHDEMAEYAELGVRVRYLMYPRAGIESHSYDKAVSVWCASNQQDEMTLAKAGGEPDARDCENPVQQHMVLARELGLQGTPMIITDTGEQVMGYIPARQLYAQMERAKPKAAP